MTTHSSLWPPSLSLPLNPGSFLLLMTGPRESESAPPGPVQRSLLWGTPSWGRFPCLVRRFWRWRAWTGEPFGTGGSHQTPEANVCTSGVSVSPGPKVKVSRRCQGQVHSPIHYVPLSFPSEKCAGWTEVASLCPISYQLSRWKSFLNSDPRALVSLVSLLAFSLIVYVAAQVSTPPGLDSWDSSTHPYP